MTQAQTIFVVTATSFHFDEGDGLHFEVENGGGAPMLATANEAKAKAFALAQLRTNLIEIEDSSNLSSFDPCDLFNNPDRAAEIFDKYDKQAGDNLRDGEYGDEFSTAIEQMRDEDLLEVEKQMTVKPYRITAMTLD